MLLLARSNDPAVPRLLFFMATSFDVCRSYMVHSLFWDVSGHIWNVDLFWLKICALWHSTVISPPGMSSWSCCWPWLSRQCCWEMSGLKPAHRQHVSDWSCFWLVNGRWLGVHDLVGNQVECDLLYLNGQLGDFNWQWQVVEPWTKRWTISFGNWKKQQPFFNSL